MTLKRIILILAFIFFAPSYSAAETPYTADLKNCDFLIDFPEKPTIESECGKQKCSHKLSYTKVFVGESTVTIDVLCKTAEENDFDRFSLNEMVETLKQQAKFQQVGQYTTSKSTIDRNNDGIAEAKYALLTGGIDEEISFTVFMSQLWMSPESFLTVEGLIEGGASDKVDRHFSRIMRSVRLKSHQESHQAK
mgnify:CR=1 FL=1